MSSVLDSPELAKIAKRGSSQLLSCEDPLSRRDDRIRTCDPLTPSQVRYQAAPRPGHTPREACAESLAHPQRTADTGGWLG